MRRGQRLAIGVIVLGIAICVSGAVMYTKGSPGLAIPGQIVHTCGMFVFFAGLIGLLATTSSARERRQMPRNRSSNQLSNPWDSGVPSLTLSWAARFVLAALLFVVVVGMLLAFSQFMVWIGGSRM